MSTWDVLSFAARHALVGGTGGLVGDATAQGIAWAVGLQDGFSVAQMFGAGLAGIYAGAGNYVAMRNAMKTCFAAGTPLRIPGGSRNVEDVRAGDLVLARDENNCEGPVEAKVVVEVFVRESLVWRLDINGRSIRTTAEHPFFVAGRGWVPCHELKVGERLLTEDGSWVAVEAVADVGEWATVYNLRVADWHTYFVGTEEWGFAVWAHNYGDSQDQVNTLASQARHPEIENWYLNGSPAENAVRQVLDATLATPTGRHARPLINEPDPVANRPLATTGYDVLYLEGSGTAAVWHYAEASPSHPVRPEGSPTCDHSCHGETFGTRLENGRRVSLESPEVVPLMKRAGFTQVGENGPVQVGDVAVWTTGSGGGVDAVHSATILRPVVDGGRLVPNETLVHSKNGTFLPARPMTLADLALIYHDQGTMGIWSPPRPG
jgi:hypothetical protein